MHRQIEGAVVNRHEPAAAQVHVRLYGVVRLHVYVWPLSVVRARFDQRDVERTELLADDPETIEVARVAAEEHAQITVDDDP